MRFALLALIALVVLAPAVSADHHASSEHAMPPMGAPEEMKQIAAMAGDYDVVFSYKMDPMADEWTETTATATFTNVLDGAAQQMTFDGEMLGMPFAGIGMVTYDRETKQFQNMWVDSMSARISVYTGNFTDETTMVVEGEDRGMGMTFQSRLTSYNMTDEGWDWKYEMSLDGTNYMETAKATYRKK